MSAAQSGSWRRAALIGVPLGTAVVVTVLELGTHFADTRNWTGTWAVIGGFLAFTAGMDIWCRAGRKR